MFNKTNQTFKNSTIVIEGNIIMWEDHMIKSADITQIWKGKCPDCQFPLRFSVLLFFVALSGGGWGGITIKLLALALYLGAWNYRYWKEKDVKGIFLESSSGKVYSFISSNEAFTTQAYDLIRDLIAKNSSSSKAEISFSGDGKIVYNSAEEKEKEKVVQTLNIPLDGINSNIIRELQNLLENYGKKNKANADILDLIENTIQSVVTDDKAELKKSFSQFIMTGLINDCNELGLNSLIEAIKITVY